MFSIFIAISAAFSASLFLVLRLYPIWRIRTSGCDAYNILLCAEMIRRERRLPPHIPDLFLLEEPAQWYPPVFLVIAALFPQRWLQRRFWLLNQLIDLVSAFMMFGFVSWYSGPLFGIAAVAIYAMMAGLVQEFAALNTRPLGLLVLNLLLLTAVLASGNVWWVPAVLICGVFLAYAHKLSAQQLWFSAPVLAAAMMDWRWMVLVPAVYLAAFLVWPRGFRQIVAGHLAIIRFWNRQWPLLGAHAVRQSPVYGDGRTRQDFYSAWAGGRPLKFARETLHQNYFAVPALLGIALAPAGNSFLIFLFGWIISVYLAAATIHLIPQLRGIGLGRQYVKFALLPSVLTTAICVRADPSPWLVAAIIAAAVLTVRQYWLVTKLLRADDVSSIRTPELDMLLTRLADDPTARIMVLPVQLCDVVAYATRRPVYWGTHAQVFDGRLEAFFPVLRRPLPDYVEDGQLTRLLLDTRYVRPEELGLGDSDVIERSGAYMLMRLKAAAAKSQPIAGAMA